MTLSHDLVNHKKRVAVRPFFMTPWICKSEFFLVSSLSPPMNTILPRAQFKQKRLGKNSGKLQSLIENDGNISALHIPTLLAHLLQAPAKRPQHLNATDQNILGHSMLHAFGHPVATCYDILGVQSVYAQVQHICTNLANGYNIMQHPNMSHEKFDHFQI